MSEKKTKKQGFFSKMLTDNPVFGLYLGICSTLAISTSINNALGMGAGVIFVLVLSNVVVSLIAPITPDDIHIPVYIVVIATLVTILQMFLNAYAVDLYTALGAFLSLIVVNCIILGRAESYASKNKVLPSIFDGLGMGLGFTIGLTLIGMFRELIGAGTLFGIQVMPSAYEPVNIFIMAPGAFLVLAMLVAVQNRIKRQKSEKTGKPAVPAEETGCMACANKAYCQAVKGKEEAK